ncbi:thiol peroxidase [Alkalicella caledoniensis]|uniref:Thiol peroxidase n=1 Tax=Alkalicella caledoniensis TaxID=2731377 RepID=A0A7G9W538_ALKCA|nr:thiol peroxidase [Alkalicella caledoniensis]QNO13800.1 thiol peroxidase [Alkalicella caledoniensis]
MQITMKGNPIVLLGKKVEVGDPAPHFTVVGQDISEVKCHQFMGKKRLISVVPSIDTGVCEQQTRRFNEEASKIADAVILTISMDLPFAQARWCGAAGIDKIQVLSDHRDASFGNAYGVLIEGLRLLTRAIFVIDANDKVTYVEYVPEVTDHPDYEKALEALKSV